MAREDEEFTLIFQANYAGLCRFLECMLGGRGGLAQDMAQESFMRLYKLGAGALPVAEARFWLFRVARNLAINEISRQETRGKLARRVRELFGQRNEPDPAENLEYEERKRVLLKLLKTLPEHQRAALLLREQEEMSYREIARVLNISESKVKVDIFRARTSLRARLNELVDRTFLTGKAD